MKKILYFITPAILFLTALFVAVWTIPQQDLHLWLNGHHTAFWNMFFKHYTAVGDYLTFAIVFLLLFKRVGDSLFLLSAYCGAGLLTQIVKLLVHAPRPAIVFDLAHHPDALPLVEGVQLHLYNSFPSGHTTIFFALFTTLSIILLRNLNRPTLPTSFVLCLFSLLAALGGYSRIYLSQHFAADVLAGGLIGLFTTLPIAYGFDKLQQKYPKFYCYKLQNLRHSAKS